VSTDIRARVITALAGTIPISLEILPGTTIPAQYATFSVMSTPLSYADDAMDATAHYVYLDLWSTTDYVAMRTAVHAAMIAAGFRWYEERGYYDAGTYQLAMTWTYTEVA
jgi:hypothetical protein